MDVLSFLHKIVVQRHFHVFNMASKIAANGHVIIIIIIIIIDSNESFIY